MILFMIIVHTIHDLLSSLRVCVTTDRRASFWVDIIIILSRLKIDPNLNRNTYFEDRPHVPPLSPKGM